MTDRRVQCFISAFKRKNLLACAICILITLVEHFSGGKELNTELRTCLLPFVDNPPLSVIVRMDVRVGEFHYVRMAQTRKGAKDEGVTVDARSVVGEPDIHHGLQFRGREVATFRVFRFDIEPGERIGGNPVVLISRIGHQLQLLECRMDRPGSKTLYRGEVDDELFHELPLQLFERNILDVVFVFEERGKAVTAFAVIVIARIGAVFAHAFEEACKVFVESL